MSKFEKSMEEIFDVPTKEISTVKQKPVKTIEKQFEEQASHTFRHGEDPCCYNT